MIESGEIPVILSNMTDIVGTHLAELTGDDRSELDTTGQHNQGP